MFNLSLLAKWFWRMRSEAESLWAKILKSKCGSVNEHLGARDVNLSTTGTSEWWQDLWSIQTESGSRHNWFGERMLKVVGNGASTSFWKDTWLGDLSLKKQIS